MAHKGVQLDREIFSCPICLDLLKDPVAIPCGHSYCMDCINAHWDTEEGKHAYSCPQCRQIFNLRAVLLKNTMLATLVEELKTIGLQAAPADYAGPSDVSCDVCTGRKLKALKSCLVCLVSYCENHLQPHYDVPPLRKHKLVEPYKNLQENICTSHNEMVKLFCRSDHQFVCYICSVDEHKGHDVVSVAAERSERQKELKVIQQNVQQRIQDKEEDVKVLQQQVEAMNHSADKAVEKINETFTQLIHLIKKNCSDVKQQVRLQQQAELNRAKELQQNFEQEISELKSRDAELKKISYTENHYQFLQDFTSLSPLSQSIHPSSISMGPLNYFEDLKVAVSELRGRIQKVLKKKMTKISQKVTEVDAFLPHREPTSRADFLKYSCKITLDPNTAHTQVLLSAENRKAALISQEQSYPSSPDRFTECCQVLSKESLTGRCYWEVTWKGTAIYVAVAYKDIKRDGSWSDCGFGFTDKSWALYCDKTSYIFCHNGFITRVSGPLSSRVGVYLDHGAGFLSFYSISGAMTLLHRVQTTFTQPLYAGFWFHTFPGNSVKIIKIK